MKKLFVIFALFVAIFSVSLLVVSGDVYTDINLITFDDEGVPVLDEYGNPLEFGMKLNDGSYAYIRNDSLGAVYGVSDIEYIPELDEYTDFLTAVYIDSATKSIGDEIFSKFINMEEICLPTSLEHIGANAFKNLSDTDVSFQGDAGDFIVVEKGNEYLHNSNIFDSYTNVVFYYDDGISYYLNGEKQVGFVEILNDYYYISKVTGFFNTKNVLYIGGAAHYFNEDMTVKNGEIVEDGNTYLYNMGKKVTGWVDSDGDGVKDSYYLFANGAKVTENKKIGGREYVYSDGKLTLRNGLVEIDGKTYYYKDGSKQGGFIEIEGKTYYFFRESGERIEAESYKIGGFYREFNSDHSIKPISGWQEKNGKKYYYIDGELCLGFTVIDEKTYYFFKSDDKYGQMAEGWQSIGGKVYYFFRYGTEKYGTMALGKQTIGGNVYYFNTTGTINTGFIGDSSGNTYFYHQSKKLKGWYTISGNTYYFTLVEGRMLTGVCSVGGVEYTFGDNGALISPSHDASNIGSVGGTGSGGFDIGNGDWSDIEFI